jgi:general stress protein 26
MAGDQKDMNTISPSEVEDRAWELMKKIDICMFVTWDGEQQRARPLSARTDRDAHAIHFLVDKDGEKNAQIAEFPTVSLGFSDIGAMKFVTISGTAAISNDRAKIHELWSDFDKAWWDSENDPDIRLLTVTPEDAELWDSPGKLVATAKMLAAAVTGAKPQVGDHGTARM